MAIRNSALRMGRMNAFKVLWLGTGGGAAFPPAWAYWKLDETTGNFADSSGNGLTFPRAGSPGYTTGVLGNAMTSTSNTDGAYNAESYYDPASWPLNSNFLVTFWANIISGGGIDFNINVGAYLDVSGGKMGGSAWTYNNWIDIPYDYTLNDWHFVAMYHNGTGFYLEIDNSSVDSDLGASDLAGYPVIYIMGASGGTSAVDEVGIWLGSNADSAIPRRSELYNNGSGWSPY